MRLFAPRRRYSVRSLLELYPPIGRSLNTITVLVCRELHRAWNLMVGWRYHVLEERRTALCFGARGMTRRMRGPPFLACRRAHVVNYVIFLSSTARKIQFDMILEKATTHNDDDVASLAGSECR